MSATHARWSIGTQDVRSSLFPLAVSVDGYVLPHRNAAGVGLAHFVVVFDGPTVTYLIVEDQWKEVSAQYFRRVQQNPSMLTSVFRNIHRTSDALLASAQRIALVATPSHSNRQLLKLYHVAMARLGRVYHFGLVPTFLDFKEYTYVTDLLMTMLADRGVVEDERGKVFALLTTSTDWWDFTIAEDEMRRLIRAIRSNAAWSSVFAHSEAMEELTTNRRLRSLLEAYRERFQWLHYGYEGPRMRLEDVIAMIQQRLRGTHGDQSIRQSVARQHARIAREQSQAIRQYALTRSDVRWFDIARKMSFYKSYRRLRQSQSYAHLEAFQQLLAQRSSISLELWRMLTPDEVESILIDAVAPPADLTARRSTCVYGRADGALFLLSGPRARRFIDRYVTTLHEKRGPLLHGQVAYPGVVEGVAVVVRTPEDVAAVALNAIIISPSLNPYMQLAMERCRAIVTDAGGLTCHAAVVAREYQVPCVVGVANASSQIRSGDRVRVDANHGIVTIVHRA